MFVIDNSKSMARYVARMISQSSNVIHSTDVARPESRRGTNPTRTLTIRVKLLIPIIIWGIER